MINGWWVKRQNRMHDRISLHRALTAHSRISLNAKKTSEKIAVRCRLPNRLRDFCLPEFKRGLMLGWMLDAHQTNGKHRQTRNNITIRLSIAVNVIVNSRFCSLNRCFVWFFLIQMFIGQFTGHHLKSQLERGIRCNGNAGGRQHNASFQIMQNAKLRRGNDTANWVRLDAACQRINFQLNTFWILIFRVCFFLLLRLSSFRCPRNYS